MRVKSRRRFGSFIAYSSTRFYIRGAATPPLVLSRTNVAQGACLRGHRGAPAACSAAMGADPAAAALDTIRPAVGLRTMGNGQAGDLELNAVDGGGHGCGCFLCVLYRVRGSSATPYMHENPERSCML